MKTQQNESSIYTFNTELKQIYVTGLHNTSNGTDFFFLSYLDHTNSMNVN